MASSVGVHSSDHVARPQSRRGSNVARKLKTIVDIVEDFATDSDIKAVVGVVDQAFELQNSLKQKNDRVETLEKEISGLKARYQSSSQDSLATYEADKEKLKIELGLRDNEVVALKDEIDREAHEIEILTGSDAKLRFEAERLQNALRVQTEKVTTNLTRIKELEGSLKTFRDDNATLQTQLRQEKDSHIQARSNHANLQQKFDKLEKEYNSLLQEWELAQSLTVKLSNQDLEQLSLNLDRMWSHAVQLVNSTLSQSLSEDVLHNEAAWRSLRNYPYGPPALPIVPINSDPSKGMRMALVLTIIARKFDVYLFQPSYLLEANSTLRDLLINQAHDESRKEAAIRGILQALLPKDQDGAASDRVQQACDEVAEIIHGLLPSGLLNEFRERLEAIAEEARDTWNVILRSNKAVALSFELEDFEHWPWNELCLNSDPGAVAVKTQGRNNDDGDYDRRSLVIFPRLYSLDESGAEPLSHGVILPVSQTAAARDEETTYLSKARGLNRERSRRHRAPNGTQVRRPSESKNFLD